jgi:hypothetical protein
MRFLRGLYGTLRVLLFGLGEPVAPGEQQGITPCVHPQKAITACTYQVGPYGYKGWYCRCRMCLAWFSC